MSKKNCCINFKNLLENNNLEKMKELIKSKKIDLNKRDQVGDTCSWTPLYWCVKYRNLEAVELLLEEGADATMVVNDPLECYGTPLDLATILGYDDIEEIIRKHLNKDIDNKTFSFKALRTKLRSSKTPSFNFKSKKTIEREEQELLNKKVA